MNNSIKSKFVIVLAFLVLSCNELPKKAREIQKKVAKTEKAQKKNAEKQLLEHLKNTKPVDVTELEAWMPKTFGGVTLERTKSMGMYGGDVSIMGLYKNIALYVYDAAGPDGTMISNKINVLGKEPESDVGEFQQRSVTVKGRMARQTYNTEKNTTTITFFDNQRFMIMIAANDHNVQETWSLVEELDFEALDNLIIE